MADIHTLEFDKGEKSLRCVFHIPVPAAGSNIAGVQWQDAVKNWKEAQDTIGSVLPDIGVELANLQNGGLIEVIEVVTFSGVGINTGQRSVEVQQAYQSAVVRVQSELQVILAFYGHSMAGV